MAITDANLQLGRLLPSHFPHIFGPSENEPLDEQATRKAFTDLTKEINEYLSMSLYFAYSYYVIILLFVEGKNMASMTEDEVAYGFVKVANETMCRPIR